MSRKSNDLIIAIIRPPLIVLGFIAKGVYKLFFGRADKRLAQQQQETLGSEIRQNLAFLFRDYGAKIVPNSGLRFPPGFDYAVVTVEVGELLFRFIRGRGDLDVQVAPKNDASDWNDVTLVIGALHNPDEMQRQSFVSLTDVDSLLRENMPSLQEAFSVAQYAATREHLTNYKRYEGVVKKQLQTEINRRLYS